MSEEETKCVKCEQRRLLGEFSRELEHLWEKYSHTLLEARPMIDMMMQEIKMNACCEFECKGDMLEFLTNLLIIDVGQMFDEMKENMQNASEHMEELKHATNPV